MDVQYIDGTKIESVANKYTFVWKGSVEKNKAKLIAKVDGILKEAEAVLAEENFSEPQVEITKEDLEKRTCSIIRSRTSTYALWDSTWSILQTRGPYLTWDTYLTHQYTELPIVRNVHCVECATAANATEEP